jgi:hypothetical protein
LLPMANSAHSSIVIRCGVVFDFFIFIPRLFYINK